MEPQLRQPGGSGTGTPFTPFAVDSAAKAAGKKATSADAAGAEAAGASTAAEGSAEAAETSRPADFRKGARRSHRPDPPAGKPVS
jgi:hypothetical protein